MACIGRPLLQAFMNVSLEILYNRFSLFFTQVVRMGHSLLSPRGTVYCIGFGCPLYGGCKDG